MLVDSHCHLNFPELYSNIDDYLMQMQNNDVQYALCIGTNLTNCETVVNLANKYSNLFATVGVHPDEDMHGQILQITDLEKYLLNSKVIGIGETGLDYYHLTNISKELQQKRFQLHIDIAKMHKLPLVIHTRESFQDTISMLKNSNVTSTGCLMHCFTEDLTCAKQCLDLGFYISISGIVTFKNASKIQEMATYIPLDRLLIETDSPFLAPVPFRGKVNHPALVKYTAEFIANLKRISFTEIAETTTNNFFKLFLKANEYVKHS